MATPQSGDIVVLGTTSHGYVLVDAISHRRIAGPIVLCASAVALARTLGGTNVWQQNVDSRGRPLGEPFLLTHPKLSVVK
jgi:hypothetical protein